MTDDDFSLAGCLTYKGAYLDRDGDYSSACWRLSNNSEKLLDISNSDDSAVLWVTTPEELHQVLEERYGHPSGMTRCVAGDTSCRVYPYPVVTSNDLSNDDLKGEVYATRIIEAARRAGIICLHDTYHGIPKRVKDECVVDAWTGGGHQITYGPAKAQKRKERDQRRYLNTPIRVSLSWRNDPDTFQGIWYCLNSQLHGLPLADITGGQCRLYYLSGIRKTLWLVEKMYGAGSFRRLDCWHIFVKKWRDHQAATESTLLKDIGDLDNQHPYYDIVVDFIAFMHKEIKRRLPAVEDDATFAKRKATITMPK